MRLPSFKRLFKNDYEEQYQTLIDRLSSSLNIGIEVLYDALNRRLTIKDNVAATVKDVNVTVNSNGLPNATTSFALDISNQVLGLEVIKADNLTNPTTYPTSGIIINYTQNGTNVLINHVTGLQSGQTYRLRIIAWGS